MIKKIILEVDTVTPSGRLYPKSVIENAIKKHHNKKLFVVMGETALTSVSLDRVCGVVEEMEIQDKTLVGRFRTLKTPLGNIIQALLDEGVELHLHPRGFGSLTEKEDHYEVQDDYALISLDITGVE